MLIEVLGSFIFTMTILCVTHKKTKDTKTDLALRDMAVAVAYYVAISITRPISMGAINPAIAFGLNVMSYL